MIRYTIHVTQRATYPGPPKPEYTLKCTGDEGFRWSQASRDLPHMYPSIIQDATDFLTAQHLGKSLADHLGAPEADQPVSITEEELRDWLRKDIGITRHNLEQNAILSRACWRLQDANVELARLHPTVRNSPEAKSAHHKATEAQEALLKLTGTLTGTSEALPSNN